MSQFQFSDFGLSNPSALEFPLRDLADTRRLGRALAAVFPDGGFIGLIGNLGAGKTTLVQSMVDALSPGLEARSPTYTLLNQYETQPPMVHIDLYRLESYDELESIGYWDYVESGRVISCVEWIDRIPHAWPGEGLIVEMLRSGDERSARLWPSSDYESRILVDLADKMANLDSSD
jgi:tRNA threonylcarbamoyl adenosine modification protein YjeE